jgi:hypothetical protein
MLSDVRMGKIIWKFYGIFWWFRNFQELKFMDFLKVYASPARNNQDFIAIREDIFIASYFIIFEMKF